MLWGQLGHPGATPTHFSPHEIRPFPKAPPGKHKVGGRQKRQALIITDTPEKDRIQGEIRSRQEKKGKNVTTSVALDDNKYKKQGTKGKKMQASKCEQWTTG
jgi:hypothetical protein